jgi:hypothetical protein
MSESAVKEQRRDLRRAMGAEAVKVVESQSELMSRLAGRLVALELVLRPRYNATTDDHWIAPLRPVEHAIEDVRTSIRALETFQDRGFWGRMAWLVTGR